MKRLILISTLLMCIFTHAFSSLDDDNTVIVIIKEPEPPKKPNRPKAPSQQQILCYYANGTLNMTFAIDEGECEITVTNFANGEVQVFNADTAEMISLYVGELTNASIRITTANGHSYYGEL